MTKREIFEEKNREIDQLNEDHKEQSNELYDNMIKFSNQVDQLLVIMGGTPINEEVEQDG